MGDVARCSAFSALTIGAAASLLAGCGPAAPGEGDEVVARVTAGGVHPADLATCISQSIGNSGSGATQSGGIDTEFGEVCTYDAAYLGVPDCSTSTSIGDAHRDLLAQFRSYCETPSNWQPYYWSAGFVPVTVALLEAGQCSDSTQNTYASALDPNKKYLVYQCNMTSDAYSNFSSAIGDADSDSSDDNVLQLVTHYDDTSELLTVFEDPPPLS